MLFEIWASFWNTTQIYKKIERVYVPCDFEVEKLLVGFLPSRQVFALQLSQRAKLFLDHIWGNTWWAESQTFALLEMFCVVLVRTRPFLQILEIVEICSLNWKLSTITSFHSGTFKAFKTIHIQDLRKAIGLFLQKVQSPKQVKWMGSNSNPYGILFYGIHICRKN